MPLQGFNLLAAKRAEFFSKEIPVDDVAMEFIYIVAKRSPLYLVVLIHGSTKSEDTSALFEGLHNVL